MNNIDSDIINKNIYNHSLLSGKIHYSLEDPISQFFYDVSDQISPYLYNIHITPNIITTLRLLIGLIAFFYFFEHKMYKTAAVLFMISYFGDCLDGHMSRKYNLESDFGDYYDHLSDMLVFIVSIYYVYTYINPKYNWIIVLIFILLFISMIHIGCEERYITQIETNKESKSLKMISCLCSDKFVDDSNLEQSMEITRFFGFGIYNLILAIIIWNFEYISK